MSKPKLPTIHRDRRLELVNALNGAEARYRAARTRTTEAMNRHAAAERALAELRSSYFEKRRVLLLDGITAERRSEQLEHAEALIDAVEDALAEEQSARSELGTARAEETKRRSELEEARRRLDAALPKFPEPPPGPAPQPFEVP